MYSIYSSTKRSHLKVERGFLIIILNLSVENLKERLNNRHNEAEWVVTDLVEVCKLQNHIIDNLSITEIHCSGEQNILSQ